MPILLEWTNFYAILGSAAGALTGFQFVVMTSSRHAHKAASTPPDPHFP